MPSSAEILALLSRMANELTIVAIGWQLVVFAAVIAVLFGWQPSRRLATTLLAMPALSVSAVSLAYGSWFNGISFAMLALTLIGLSGRQSAEPSTIAARGWPIYAGIAMLVFGLNYTHFFDWDAGNFVYASPVGVIPCPTLALLAGIVLLTRGFQSRAVMVVVATWATFYGLFGVVRLNVTLDVLLGVGAAALWLSVRGRATSPRGRSSARRPSPA